MTALLHGLHDLLAHAVASLPTPTPPPTGSALQAAVAEATTPSSTPPPGSTAPSIDPSTASASDWTSTATATVVAASIAAVAVLIGLIAPFTKWSPTKKAADAALKSAQVAADAVKVNARSADAAQASADAPSKSADAALHSAEASDRNATASGKRADQDALSKRYQEASIQLGHDKAPVRLAGVYSMARLADDWLEQRQTCIDVLCAYLRMPPSDSQASEEAHVRRSVLDAFRQRLQTQPTMRTSSWADCTFDLSGAHLEDINFDNCQFSRLFVARGARFTGRCSFRGTSFERGLDISSSEVSGALNLTSIAVSDGAVACQFMIIERSARFTLNITGLNSRVNVSLDRTRVKCATLSIQMPQQEHEHSSLPIDLDSLVVDSGSTVTIWDPEDLTEVSLLRQHRCYDWTISATNVSFGELLWNNKEIIWGPERSDRVTYATTKRRADGSVGSGSLNLYGDAPQVHE